MTAENRSWKVTCIEQDGVRWDAEFIPNGTYARQWAAVNAARGAIRGYVQSGEFPTPPRDPQGNLIHDTVDFVMVIEATDGVRERYTGRATYRPTTYLPSLYYWAVVLP